LARRKSTYCKKRHVEAFVNEVDVLRDDVARIEKRLAKLLKKPTPMQFNPINFQA